MGGRVRRSFRGIDRDNPRLCPARLYFSRTNNKTKIAQIPTVIGNWTTIASRIPPPRGSANVSSIIARAVSTPTTNLPFEFIWVCLASVVSLNKTHNFAASDCKPVYGSFVASIRRVGLQPPANHDSTDDKHNRQRNEQGNPTPILRWVPHYP